MDGNPVFLTVRASTTKNHRQANVPLTDELTAALREIQPINVGADAPVFVGGIPDMDVFRADLEKAGIPFLDAQGRCADFHSLRHTLCTDLNRAGVAPRVAMEIMRHSDFRLTAKNYTDTALLPTADAIGKLPTLGVA